MIDVHIVNKKKKKKKKKKRKEKEIKIFAEILCNEYMFIVK